MNTCLKVCISSLIGYCLSSSSIAQDVINLDDQDIQRLGIVFAEVIQSDNKAGSLMPATVITAPNSLSTLRAVYAGNIQQWHAKPGERVSNNQTLATIQSSDLLNIQKQWLAAYNLSEQMNFEYNKDKQLFDQGIISEQRFLVTQSKQKQAELAFNSETHQLSRAGLNTEQRQGLLNSTQPLGEYYLRAKSDGTLSHQAAMAGTFVDINEELASINGAKLWLTAQLPARIAAKLEIAQNLHVAGINQELTLEQKDLEIESASQTIEVLASFNEQTNLLPGQLVSLIIPPTNSGILVPAEAVVHGGNQTSVFIKTDNGVEVRVLTLTPLGSDYLAQAGIRNGDQVAVRGAAILKGILLGLGGE